MEQALVDKIVRNVLEELRGRPAAPSAEGAGGPLRLDQPVITGEDLEAALDGHKEVEVAPRAVLTPSARDFLRERGIQWKRVTPAPAAAEKGGRFKAIVVRSTPAVSAAVEELTGSGAAGWTMELAGGERDAVDSAVSMLCRAEVVLAAIFTGQPEGAACRANRNEKIRAAAIHEAGQLRRVMAELEPNLLCIDPGEKTFVELRNLLREALVQRP